MWRFNNSFLFFLVITLGPAVCGAEMICGTVLSMDREQQTFVLRTADGEEVLVNRDTAGLPLCMRVGKKIRVWGSYSVDSTSFQATDIRGPGRNHGQDPTGVRARLGRGRNCRMTALPLTTFDPTAQ